MINIFLYGSTEPIGSCLGGGLFYEIIDVRNEESIANGKNVFISHTDMDLTSTGYMQAQKAAEYLKDICLGGYRL